MYSLHIRVHEMHTVHIDAIRPANLCCVQPGV